MTVVQVQVAGGVALGLQAAAAPTDTNRLNATLRFSYRAANSWELQVHACTVCCTVLYSLCCTAPTVLY